MSWDEVDEEFAKDNQGEEATETTLNAEWTLSTHTCIKNKVPNQFTKVDKELAKNIKSEETAETTLSANYTRTTHAHVKNDKGKEADETKQDAENTLSIHTCIKNKIPNLFAEGKHYQELS